VSRSIVDTVTRDLGAGSPGSVELEVSEQLTFFIDDADMPARDEQNDRQSFASASHADVMQLALVAKRGTRFRQPPHVHPSSRTSYLSSEISLKGIA